MSPDPTSEGEQKCQYPQSVSQKPLNRNYFFIHTYTVSDGETVKDLSAPSDGNETEKKMYVQLSHFGLFSIIIPICNVVFADFST